MTATAFDPHALIAKSRLGVLATIKSNGLPQLSPVTPFYDAGAGVIYVSMTEGRAKTANLRSARGHQLRWVGLGDGRGDGDADRTGNRPPRRRGRSARRLLPQRRGGTPRLGRVPSRDGVRPQGADDDDHRPRLRREDPLTSNCL